MMLSWVWYLTFAVRITSYLYRYLLANWMLFKRKGILHRDIGWANVLCNPQHNEDRNTIEVDESVNCIEKVLQVIYFPAKVT